VAFYRDCLKLCACEVVERKNLGLEVNVDSIDPAQALFPKFDYFGRKFTPYDACAAAGFRPHFE
jgi:hypothetical protein